jgi:GNAT superfamily N-acetyltransferase
MDGLQMVWKGSEPTPAAPPPGYRIRLLHRGDDAALIALLNRVGWPQWDEEFLAIRLGMAVTDGWFVVEASDGSLAASAVALWSEDFPGGGELGWVAADPSHAGRGLGKVVVEAVVSHFVANGIDPIHLHTEDHRLPALSIYLAGGWLPVICDSSSAQRWRTVHERLGRSFDPERYPTGLHPAG